jgi:hypothetical protein
MGPRLRGDDSRESVLTQESIVARMERSEIREEPATLYGRSRISLTLHAGYVAAGYVATPIGARRRQTVRASAQRGSPWVR